MLRGSPEECTTEELTAPPCHSLLLPSTSSPFSWVLYCYLCLFPKLHLPRLIHHNRIALLPNCHPLKRLSLFFICAALLYGVSTHAHSVNDFVVLPSASPFHFVNISVSVICSVKISPMCHSTGCLSPRSSPSGLMAVMTNLCPPPPPPPPL